jgi:hypothetical protein
MLRIGQWESSGIRRSRLVTAGLTGAFFPAGRIIWNWIAPRQLFWLDVTLFTALYFLGLGIACRPLRSHRVVWRLGLVASVGFAVVGCTNVLLHEQLFVRFAPWLLSVGAGAMLIGVWGLSGSVLCSVVFLHNRYWPVYPPGHCKKCGYCLYGLTSQRCPECGTPFTDSHVDPAEICC